MSLTLQGTWTGVRRIALTGLLTASISACSATNIVESPSDGPAQPTCVLTDIPARVPTPKFTDTPNPVPTLVPAEYDSDGDGLIEVSSLEQLDALRYDLDGNGLADSDSNTQAYAAAFPAVALAESCTGCTGYELARSLDFRHPDSYASGAINPAWISGSGWVPIAPDYVYGSPHDTSSGYDAVFDGNGHTISNLYIRRMLTTADEAQIGADDRKAVGLFGVVHETGIVRRIGMVDVDLEVTNYEDVGGLVGVNGGQIAGSYVRGTIAGVSGVGGLTGENFGAILTSYTKGNVSGRSMVGGLSGYNAGVILASYTKSQVSGGSEVGALVGYNHGEILASYAASQTSASEERAGGLVGASLGTVVASYWDTQVSGQESPVSSGDTLGISGLTTSELQQPTQATGIYALWQVDLDNADGDYNLDTGREDFWDFGDSIHYPALKVDFNADGVVTWWEFGDQDRELPSPLPSLSTESTPTPAPAPPLPTPTRVWEYDGDGDGLIEICSLEQLDAIRHDLDGDGRADGDSSTSAAVYGAAFPNIPTGGPCNGTCQGYELAQPLDFREDGHYSSGVVNGSWIAGSGWLPIGSEETAFSSAFDGNGYSISGLYINRLTILDAPRGLGLFGVTSRSSDIRDISLAEVQATGLETIGSLVGINEGRITNSHIDGNVRSVDWTAGGLVAFNHGIIVASSSHARVSGGWQHIGGLVGINDGTIRGSYATGIVSGAGAVGGLIGSNGGQVSASYATGEVSAGWNTGGLVGSNGGTIIAAYATGSVCGDRDNGGLVGWNSTGGTISNSYATGSVAGIDGVGGLAGTNAGVPFGDSGLPGKVVASYSIGIVSGVGSVGGFVGANYGVVLDSLWDSETSMQATASGFGEVDGAQSASTADLQSQAAGDGIFANWNDGLWDFGHDDQYPALKADMDGDDIITWQEFGRQIRDVPDQIPQVGFGDIRTGLFPSQGAPAQCHEPESGIRPDSA